MKDETRAKPDKQVWFRIEEVEISWLPVRESAFLLWVLVLLLGVWFAIGAALGAL
jgi:hypothetical protein